MVEKGTELIDKKRQIYSDTIKRMQAIVFSEKINGKPIFKSSRESWTMNFNAKSSSKTATN